jgi:hypothetical protein
MFTSDLSLVFFGTILQDDKETAAILEAIKSDRLRERETAELQDAERIILTSSKLIAPSVSVLISSHS